MVFLPLDRNEVLLVNWSVFPLFRSDSDDLISIEGITSVGLLEVLFPDRLWDVWSSCGHSAVFTSGADSECTPLANKGVGLGLSSAGPVASRPPLGDRSASAV